MVMTMRDKKRIKRILKLLEKLWNEPQNMDLRLGQLLEKYVFFMGERGDNTSVTLFYQADETTESILKARLEEE